MFLFTSLIAIVFAIMSAGGFWMVAEAEEITELRERLANDDLAPGDLAEVARRSAFFEAVVENIYRMGTERTWEQRRLTRRLRRIRHHAWACFGIALGLLLGVALRNIPVIVVVMIAVFPASLESPAGGMMMNGGLQILLITRFGVDRAKKKKAERAA